MDNAAALPTTPQLINNQKALFVRRGPTHGGAGERRLPFLCQHDCQHASCRALPISALDFWFLIQVDFPKDLSAGDIEATEIVLAVRVVVRREVGEYPDTAAHH